jgi:hypothetical protein
MTLAGAALIGAVFTGLLLLFDDSEHDPRDFLRFEKPVEYRAIDGSKIDARPPQWGVTIRVFYSVDCPIATDQLVKFAAMAASGALSGRVHAIGIHVDLDIPDADLAAHAAKLGLNLPIVADRDQAIAHSFGVETVPLWIVTDAVGAVVYRGPLDTQFASRSRRVPGTPPNLLEAALHSWFADGRTSDPSAETIGCPLPLTDRAPHATPTYARTIAPILRRSCVPCHKPDGAAPFALIQPEQAAKRADDIAAVTASGLMPPWKPIPGSTPPLAHDRSLTTVEIEQLQAWAKAGAPMGDMTAQPFSSSAIAPGDSDEWPLGPPDLVLTMPEEFVVPASGDDIYRCFVLPTGLTEDVALTAVDVRPGNPKVVHHVFNYVDTRELGKSRDAESPGPGYDCFSGFAGDQIFGAMGGWTPGHRTRHFRDGVGLSLPKGADIVMQIHYHPIGTTEPDRTRIGLYFAKKPVRKHLQWVSACENPERFALPAGQSPIDFTTILEIPIDVDLHALTPHMHFLGRSIAAFADLPDGRSMPLVSIPDWDFNLQETYYLREPLRLPKGSRVRILSRYDNSAANPFNPNRPPKTVRWGEGSNDDMMIVFLALTQADQDLTQPGAEDRFMEEFFRSAR